ncbi:hypothetical protein EV673_2612 [Limnobacter thiooxidans]|uniref:DUF1109 domain-containing protein n=1 Tax=Limnobacter thiooxidans TaxID=131080 RepID=A0AA86MCV9_9BURK|nr:DUF1109 domain-containing protein [Limnobacter sp.]MCZ8014069.1 DUF1109 domain-containing protein [Limnobacter sp.]RZS38237.1 hypothetical protein EV673_2612 [Limnobacter thiooxidans]BET25316.1 DUF1109 domain-containing protein [Limnobacter thiooxidans]
MKTVDLINLLSSEAGPAPKVSMARRLVPAALLGGLIAAILVLAVLGLIPQTMFAEPGPWIKITYASALAFAAAWLVARLGKPGASGQQAFLAVLGVVGVMAMAGIISYLGTPEPERAAALMGHSWLVCPWAILSLSVPVMAGAFWAMRGLAPTNLTLAGAACGVFSGAVAALAYALACTEPAAPFIAIWYTLGIALAGALGALLGPKFLRW